jgi:ABC-type xylose transport system permease subunit
MLILKLITVTAAVAILTLVCKWLEDNVNFWVALVVCFVFGSIIGYWLLLL